MGIEQKDRYIISELLGKKLFVNEIVAFDLLKNYASDDKISVNFVCVLNLFIQETYRVNWNICFV